MFEGVTGRGEGVVVRGEALEALVDGAGQQPGVGGTVTVKPRLALPVSWAGHRQLVETTDSSDVGWAAKQCGMA